jgi:hypothetical protein
MVFKAGTSGNPQGRPSGETLVNPKSLQKIKELKNKKQRAKLKLFNQFGTLNAKAMNYFHRVLDAGTSDVETVIDADGNAIVVDGKYSEATVLRVASIVATEYNKVLKELDTDISQEDIDDEKPDTRPMVYFGVQDNIKNDTMVS